MVPHLSCLWSGMVPENTYWINIKHSTSINWIFTYAKTKAQISFPVTAKLISTFVFANRIEQSLFFLNPTFQAPNYLLWLHRLVCVRHGQKPRRQVFLHKGSNVSLEILCLHRSAGYLLTKELMNAIFIISF